MRSPATAGVLEGVLVALTVAVAAMLSLALLSGVLTPGERLDGVGLVAWLARQGDLGYAAWVAWLLIAPLVLVAARCWRGSPWPWALACGVHVTSLVALVVRLRHLVPDAGWVLAAGGVLAGLGSLPLAVRRAEAAR